MKVMLYPWHFSGVGQKLSCQKTVIVGFKGWVLGQGSFIYNHELQIMGWELFYSVDWTDQTKYLALLILVEQEEE